MNSIYCVVLNYKNISDTLECLKSVEKIKTHKVNVIVVDNGSQDGSAETIIKESGKALLIRSEKNLGYAGGNNLGIKKALELGASHVWVLNNDTAVDESAVSGLMDVFENDEKAGMAGSLIMYFDRPKEVWFAGGIYSPFTGLTSHYLENREFDNDSKVLSGNSLDYVSGCSFMISAGALKKSGMFDENLFLLYEEIDLCNRLKKAGFKIFMAEKSIVYHKVSRTLKDSPVKLYYFTRNRLYVSYKHYPAFLFFVLLWCVRWPLLPALIKRRRNLKAVLRAFADFFRKKMGEYHES